MFTVLASKNPPGFYTLRPSAPTDPFSPSAPNVTDASPPTAEPSPNLRRWALSPQRPLERLPKARVWERESPPASPTNLPRKRPVLTRVLQNARGCVQCVRTSVHTAGCHKKGTSHSCPPVRPSESAPLLGRASEASASLMCNTLFDGLRSDTFSRKLSRAATPSALQSYGLMETRNEASLTPCSLRSPSKPHQKA